MVLPGKFRPQVLSTGALGYNGYARVQNPRHSNIEIYLGIQGVVTPEEKTRATGML